MFYLFETSVKQVLTFVTAAVISRFFTSRCSFLFIYFLSESALKMRKCLLEMILKTKIILSKKKKKKVL